MTTAQLAQQEARPVESAILLPYQWGWINDLSDFAVCVKSRQIGISFAEAFRVVEERITGSRVRDYWYSSADESAAEVFIRHCQYWLGVWQQVAEIREASEIFDGIRQRVLYVEFDVLRLDGRMATIRINALSSNPTSMRSKSGDVGLDEYDWHRDQMGMMAAAQPVTMRGGRLRVLSTYNGMRDLHALRLIGERALAGEARPTDPAISLHVVDIHKAVDQGLVESINLQSGTTYDREGFKAMLRARCRTQAQWEQEYECKPSSDADSYFPHELTRPLVREQAPPVRGNLPEFLLDIERCCGDEAVAVHAGCDVGRHDDRFVIRVRARMGGRQLLVGCLEYQDQPWSAIEAACTSVMELRTRSRHASGRQVRRMAIDKSGLGDQLAERMSDRYRSRIEGIAFTSQSKMHLAEQLRVACEERAIDLEDDAVTLGQYASVRKVQTLTGKHRYDADADETGHADRFWADALCVEAGADYARGPRGFVNIGNRTFMG